MTPEQQLAKLLPILVGLTKNKIGYLFVNNTIEGKFCISIDHFYYKQAKELYPDLFVQKTAPYGYTANFFYK